MMLTGIERTAKISEVSRRCRSLLPNLSIRKIINAVYFSTTGAGAPASGCFFCMEHEAKKVADSGFLFTPQWQICQRNNNAIIGDDLNGDFKIMKLDDYPKTYNNVVKNSATANFDRKCQTFATLPQAVEPGSVVTSAGALYTSGDDAILCLSYADAGSNVPVIVADRLIYVYPEAIRAVMGSATNAALAALTANGNIRLTSDDVVIAE